MNFDPTAYGRAVQGILALDGDGQRLMPLASGRCSSEEARQSLRTACARALFPDARAAEAALSGLWLYFSCYDESHSLAQSISSSEGSFWHGIMHRQEPDAGNAAYWFRIVGKHPTFPRIRDEAERVVQEIGVNFRIGPSWNPFAFIEFCEHARQKPASELERAALEIQRAEWQILFDYCARPAA